MKKKISLFLIATVSIAVLLGGCFLFESHYQLSISPLSSYNPVGTQHTVTIELSKTGLIGGGPVQNENVSLIVTGANPTSTTVITDLSGKATFSYTGNGTGTDTIIAAAMGVSATATKIWTKSTSQILAEIMDVITKFDNTVPQSYANVNDILSMGSEAVPVLISLLSTPTHPLEVRWAGIYALSRMVNPEEYTEIKIALGDPNETIRAIAAAMYVGTGDSTSLSILQSAANSNAAMLFSHPPILLSDFADRALTATGHGASVLPLFDYMAGIVTRGDEPGISKVTVTKDDENCVINVNLYIEISGAGATESLAQRWKDGIESAWNGHKFGCYHVVFNVDIKVRGAGDTPEASRDQVAVVSINPTQTHISRTYLGAPNGGSSSGTWDNQDTGNVAAHEAGHLMGLGDEYSYDDDGNYVNNNPQTDDPQSIMAQTWGSVSALQSHIDSLMRAAGISVPATMLLLPKVATNVIGSDHTVVANVKDPFGEIMMEEKVTFKVTGVSSITSVQYTDQYGNAVFTYSYQNEVPGVDLITAKAGCCVSATALKYWVLPNPK